MGAIGRHTLVYGAGIVLSRAVSFLMLPIYTNYLTPADYGVIQLIEMTLDVIAIVAGGQLAAGIFRYYHQAETDRDRQAVVSTALWLLTATYALVGLVTFLLAPDLSSLIFGSPRHAALIQLAAGTLALSSLVIAPLAFLRVRDRSTVFVTVSVVKLVVSLVLNVLFLVVLEMGAKGVFLSTFITNLVIGLGLAVAVVRQTGLEFSPVVARKLLRYGLPLIATQLATFVATFGDRYFLQSAADETAVGLYALAYQFGFLLATVGCIPFEMVWDPARFRIAQRDDRDQLYAQGFIYLNVLLISTAVGITLFVGDVLRLMTAPAFHSAADLVPIILVAYIFQGWVGTQDIGIRIRDKTEYLTLGNWLGALVALTGYALLIPRFLGLGAAVATVLAFAVRYITVYLFSQRLWPVRYQWGPVLRLLGIAMVVCLPAILYPVADLGASLAVHAALLLAYGLMLWNLGILSPTDRERIRTGVAALAATDRFRSRGRLPSRSAQRPVGLP